MTRKKEDFYDKIKRLANKAEDLIDKQVDKLEKSGVLDKIEEKIDQSGVYMGKKIEQFKKSNIPDKIDDFVDQTEKSARETIKKSQDVGDKISTKIEDIIDDLKTRTRHKPNNPKKPEKPESKELT